MPVYHLAVLGTAFIRFTSASAASGDNGLHFRRDLVAPAQPVTGWKYAGCFIDTVAPRSLDGQGRNDATKNSAEECIAWCADGEYAYAGMEYAQECFCGNDRPVTKVTEADCNMPCAGDSGQPCGAGSRLSVYTNDLMAPDVAGWKYAGCYADSTPSTLSGDETSDPDEMTWETCIEFCDEDEYKFAGLKDGSGCLCGNTLPSKKESDSDCDTPCTGEEDEDCGATNRVTLFRNIARAPVEPQGPAPIEGWSYVGCIQEGTNGRALTYQATGSVGATSMTNELCTAACKAAGYSLAGTEYAEECWCGNSYSNGGGDLKDGCTMKCKGNTKSLCGGPDRLSAWSRDDAPQGSTSSVTRSSTATQGNDQAETKTSASVAATSSAAAVEIPDGWGYKGCYVDPPGRAMEGAPGSPSQTMTPQKCIATCKSNGFSVAGLEYSEECFCGNALNNAASKTAESDCNMPCAGDASQKCGAGSRLSIYSTGDLTIWPIPIAKEKDLPPNWAYKGCIFDNNNPYVLEWLYEDAANYATSNMTINTCLSRCQKWGYSAAGVEYGRQCACGDLGAVANRGDIFKDDSFCSMPCPGDRNYTCGAGNHINYYEWVGKTPLNTFNYASGNAAGQYQHFSTAPLVPLISSVGINDKVVFVEKHGTSWDDTEGSFEFDYSTNTYRELALKTDVFCSASFTLPDKAGRMINIGGWSAESVYGIRFFTPDSPQGKNNGTNVWEEDYSQLRLFDPRWYPTAIVLSNGSLLAMGGESGSDAPIVPSAEVLPHPAGVTESTYLDYLQRAEDIGRTNSYPFLAILPSGDMFFAQFNETRILSQVDFHSIRKLPDMPGSVVNPLTGRNYPLQGTMMIMPQHAPYTDPLTILICGGTTHEPGNDALDNCVIMEPDTPGAEWTIERMPSKRVMPTMVALPDGRYLMLNGAKVGRGGFGLADNPNLNAIMYDPVQPLGARMTVLANTTIARLYHSEAVLLSDGKVMVSGSDPQDEGKHPQEKRLEYFLPDYILSGAAKPTFTITQKDWAYGGQYTFKLTKALTKGAAAMRVSLMASIGSTHGITMGQRTLFPSFSCSGLTCTVQAPPNAFVSPPSWYQLFVLDGPTPSQAVWVRIGGDPGKLGDWPKLPGFTTPGV